APGYWDSASQDTLDVSLVANRTCEVHDLLGDELQQIIERQDPCELTSRIDHGKTTNAHRVHRPQRIANGIGFTGHRRPGGHYLAHVDGGRIHALSDRGNDNIPVRKNTHRGPWRARICRHHDQEAHVLLTHELGGFFEAELRVRGDETTTTDATDVHDSTLLERLSLVE